MVECSERMDCRSSRAPVSSFRSKILNITSTGDRIRMLIIPTCRKQKLTWFCL